MFKTKVLGFFLVPFLAYSCSESAQEVELSDSAINTGYVEYLLLSIFIIKNFEW